MKQSSYKGKSPLPDFVIDAACAGNAEAVERVLQHYDGYFLTANALYDRITTDNLSVLMCLGACRKCEL